MAETSIEWATHVWNPSTGCDRVSPGCDNCYAMRLAKRLKGMGSAKYQRDGDPRTSGPGFGVNTHADALDLPLRWRKPRRVFVNSMSDLFHDDIPESFIANVFSVMARTPRHTYQVLTKRPARMRSLLNRLSFRDNTLAMAPGATWPLPNVWLGVSVEDQKWAHIRIPALIGTPAAVRWLSCEPLLGPIDLDPWLNLIGASTAGPWTDALGRRRATDGRGRSLPSGIGGMTVSRIPASDLHWIVVGGESGPGARPMHPDWARHLRDRALVAKVPFFFKQWGEWAPIGPLYEQDDDDGEADEARMDAVTYEVVDKREVVELERDGTIPDGYQPGDPRTWLMAKVGKKAAGRELDGREWSEYPA